MHSYSSSKVFQYNKSKATSHCPLSFGKAQHYKTKFNIFINSNFWGKGNKWKSLIAKRKKKGKTHHQGKWRMQSHVQPKNHYSRIVNCINSLWGCPQSDFLVFIHASIGGVPHSNFFLQNKPFHWPTTNISRTWITPQQYENLNLFPSPK